MRGQLSERFSADRRRLQTRLADRLRDNMSAMLADAGTADGGVADVWLVAADGRKLAAHVCILWQRAPIFFRRYVELTLEASRPRGANARPVEVAVSDVDFAGLAFFIRSVYTDEEIRQFGDTDPGVSESNDGSGPNAGPTDGPTEFRGSSTTAEHSPNNVRNGADPSSDFYCSNNDNYGSGTSGKVNTTDDRYHCDGEIPTTSSPDSLNAELSEDRSPSLARTSRSPDFLGASAHRPTPSDLSSTAPTRIMSQSYPSSSDSSPTVRPLFGDTLKRQMSVGGGAAQMAAIAGAPPIMTSFRELAASQSSCASPRCASVQRLAGTPADELTLPPWPTQPSNEVLSSSPSRRPRANHKLFPMFIHLNESPGGLMSHSYPQPYSRTTLTVGTDDSGTSTIHTGSLASSTSEAPAPPPSDFVESIGSLSTLRSRSLRARRLSVTSLTSLTSIDLTSSQEGALPPGDRCAASQLGADLLAMLRDGRDADVVVAADDGTEITAHRCVLAASCAFFRRQLLAAGGERVDRVELKGFSRSSVHFLVSFLYGGLTTFPADDEEGIDVWEVIALAIHLNLEELAEVAVLHIRTYKCHYFHKPCATCVSAIFDALPQFFAIKCLRELYDEALAWQARHFARIWKSRVFTHLAANWQAACLNALLERVDEENVIDVLLSCERLQLSLARMKVPGAAEAIAQMVASVAEFCTDYLIGALDAVVASRAYRTYGLSLALNLSFLEEILPSLIHSLSAEVAVRTFVSLRDLIVLIQQECTTATAAAVGNAAGGLRGSVRHLNGSNLSLLSISYGNEEWNPRFLHLNRRLYELTDRHLLHYAASVVKCDAWQLLSAQERNRINETGIFVEMEMPRAPPPRFSSLNRSVHDGALTSRSPRHTSRVGVYNRSTSVGVHLIDGHNEVVSERTRSLERGTSVLALVEAADEEEDTAVGRRRGLERITELNHNTNSSGDIDCYRSRVSLQSQSSNKVRGGSLKTRKETLTQIIQDKTNQAFSSPKIGARSNEMDGSKNEENLENSAIPKQLREEIEHNKRSANETNDISTEETLLLRQNTHTVITVQQHRNVGSDPLRMGVPQIPSNAQTAATQKPRYLVRPMPKNLPPLAVTPLAVICQLDSDDKRRRSTVNETPKKQKASTDPAPVSRSSVDPSSTDGSRHMRSALPRPTPAFRPTNASLRQAGTKTTEPLKSLPASDVTAPAKARYLRSTLSLKARQGGNQPESTIPRSDERAKANC